MVILYLSIFIYLRSYNIHICFSFVYIETLHLRCCLFPLAQVDVFSFGIVMWEILTGEEPYANMHYGAIIGIQFIAYI